MRYSQEDFHFQLASLLPKVAVQCLIQARYLEQKENMLSLGNKSKNVFRFFEFRLGINFFHFRLRRFEKVESRLGSPEAGVEIGTG